MSKEKLDRLAELLLDILNEGMQLTCERALVEFSTSDRNVINPLIIKLLFHKMIECTFLKPR